MVAALGARVRSVSLRRPTLEDAFVKLTGHEIRDEAPSAVDALRDATRALGRRVR